MKGQWRRYCGCLVSFTEHALGICATCLWMSDDEDKAARYSDSFLRSSLEHFHSACGDGLRLCECTCALICTDHWIGWVSFLQLKHLSRPFIYQETNTETIVESFEWPKKRSNNNWLCTSKAILTTSAKLDETIFTQGGGKYKFLLNLKLVISWLVSSPTISSKRNGVDPLHRDAWEFTDPELLRLHRPTTNCCTRAIS